MPSIKIIGTAPAPFNKTVTVKYDGSAWTKRAAVCVIVRKYMRDRAFNTGQEARHFLAAVADARTKLIEKVGSSMVNPIEAELKSKRLLTDREQEALANELVVIGHYNDLYDENGNLRTGDDE